MTRREKDEEEADQDDEEYRRFLLEMGGGEAEVRKILGMGEQPVPAVRLDEDEDVTEGLAADAEVSEKDLRKQKKKAAKRQERKVKEDDDFLMK